MTVYPNGAGPQAGAFSGTVYTPPAAGTQAVDGSVDTTTTTRPSSAQAVAKADSAGRMVSTFTTPVTVAWSVRRIVVQSTIRGQALVYIGSSIDPANLVSGTIAGNLDENDANQPYLIPEGQSMFVHWVSGGVCRARIEYDVL